MRCFVPYMPNLGDKRIRRRFAWLPINIPTYNGEYNADVSPSGETVVWLEWVTVEEQYCWRGRTDLVWKVIREVSEHANP